MTDRVIACANCGAKYKLPETFKGAKARCKACGSTIEVGQETPAAQPAAAASAAKPSAAPAAPRAAAAAAPTAAARSEPRPAPAEHPAARAAGGRREAPSRARPGAAGRHAAAGHGRGDAPTRGRHGRRGAEPEVKSKAPLMIGIGVVVIAVAAGAFFMLKGGGEEQGKTEGAKQVASAAETPKQEPIAAARTEPPKPAEAAAKKEGGTAEPASAQKEPAQKQPDAKPPESTSEAKEPDAKKEEPKPKEPKKPAPVKPFDAKAELEELPFPADVSEAERTQLNELATTAVEDLSIHGQRALKKLEAAGRKAMPAILNKLRSIDYMNPAQVDSAFPLHQTIEKILLGNNVDFRPRDPTKETISQEDAWHNSAQLKPLWRFWQNQVGSGDPEAWDKWAELRKKNLAEKKPADDKLPDFDK